MPSPRPTRIEAMSAAPELRHGFAVWALHSHRVRTAFVGRGPSADRSVALAAASPDGELPRLAWPRQVHSAHVLIARPGECGEGDALVTSETGLAVAVATADCVPILIAGEHRLAAVHAGWRGLADEVLAAAVAALGEPATSLHAVIGPAIGPCCYEVGEDVAARVAAVSDAAIIVPGRGARPHLDLQAAAGRQLCRLGVEVDSIARCTRCHPRELWSYRRDGAAAGRNLAFLWRTVESDVRS
ncbi:MAG: peptidoglycan editing factor PgeF [Acidobacteriota bacterium]